MASWRLAKSLETLRAQVNAAYPSRSKSSDGTIGDSAHASRTSDHNPNRAGVVQAIDLTHDPARGFDSYKFAETLRQNKDPRIKYVISNGRIFSSLVSPWTWRNYTGSNKHDKHVHVSVDDRPAMYDDTRPWAAFPSGNISESNPTVTPDLSRTGRQKNITATVFGGPDDLNYSAYAPYKLVDPTKPGVALPFRFYGERPKVKVFANGKSVVCEIVDIGPWNTNDPYWQKGARPQAESGRDTSGRKTNLAGIDLTPAAAKAIGINGKGKVDWEFATAAARTVPPAAAGGAAAAVAGGGLLAWFGDNPAIVALLCAVLVLGITGAVVWYLHKRK